jgi:hypothetical protein
MLLKGHFGRPCASASSRFRDLNPSLRGRPAGRACPLLDKGDKSGLDSALGACIQDQQAHAKSPGCTLRIMPGVALKRLAATGPHLGLRCCAMANPADAPCVGGRGWVDAGGLLCYGPSITALFARVADQWVETDYESGGQEVQISSGVLLPNCSWAVAGCRK